MTNCPACAEPVPASAEACPRCGIRIHQLTSGRSPTGDNKSSSISYYVLLVAGVVFLALLFCGGFLKLWILPRLRGSRVSATHMQCRNNLRQIGLALHNYHDKYNCFPPQYLADAEGKPMHSWRVILLPYLDESALYARYKFDEPWDGPNNSRLLSSMPTVYRCPSDTKPGQTMTNYAAVAGPNSIFRGATPVKVGEVTDGSSNTLIVGEVLASGAAIPWMAPVDVDITAHPKIGDPAGFSSKHTGGAKFTLADGSVRFIPETIAASTLEALFTSAGGEPVGEF